MTPAAVTAWIQVANLLLAAGVPVFTMLHGWLTSSHPSLTPDQINAAYVAILSDDSQRIAFGARVAAGG